MTMLEREIAKLSAGSKFYVNAISCTVAEIAYLRQAIRDGILFPNPDTFDMFSRRADIWQAIARGEIIAPQAEYTKLKG